MTEDMTKCHSRTAEFRDQVVEYRKRFQLLESHTMVEIEVLTNTIMLLKDKNSKLQSTIEDANTLERNEQQGIADLKRKIAECEKAETLLLSDLRAALVEKESFLSIKTLLTQKLDQKVSESQTYQALLSAKQNELNQRRQRKQVLVERLRLMRDKEYSSLETLKQVQVEQMKFHADSVRVGKHLQSMSNTLLSMRRRASEIQDHCVEAQKDVSGVNFQNNQLEKNLMSLGNNMDTVDLGITKAEKDLLEVEKRFRKASDLSDVYRIKFNQINSDKQVCETELQALGMKVERIIKNNEQQRFDLKQLSTESEMLKIDLQRLSYELQGIKRINIDCTTAPALIESDSPLIARFQINSYLRFAQSQPQPIPLLVEKLTELLNTLGTARERSDEALGLLGSRNAEIGALRQTNLVDQERLLTLSSCKYEALVRTIENQLLDCDRNTEVFLNGCVLASADLSVLSSSIRRLCMNDRIVLLSMRCNVLTDSCASKLSELLYELPYLNKLDLDRNCLSESTVRSFETLLRTFDGITHVTVEQEDHLLRIPGIITSHGVGCTITAKSGKMIRLTITMKDQRDECFLLSETPVTFAVPTLFAPDTSDARAIGDSGVVAGPSTSSSSTIPQPRKKVVSTVERYTSPQKEAARLASTSSRLSSVSDESFVRQLNISKRNISVKAIRLGIRSTSPFS